MRNNTALYVSNSKAKHHLMNMRLDPLGIKTHNSYTLRSAKCRLSEHQYDLLLVDFEPLDEELVNFCTYTCLEYHEMVIMVLLARANPILENELFECGVDDITSGKHNDPNSLRARIRRRLAAKFSVKHKIIMFECDTLIDLNRKEVHHKGSHYRLKGVSYKLLQYFLNNSHRPISREELLNSHIWANSVCAPNRVEQGKAIDMAIARLRRLIEPDPSHPQIITTVRGDGWILDKKMMVDGELDSNNSLILPNQALQTT